MKVQVFRALFGGAVPKPTGSTQADMRRNASLLFDMEIDESQGSRGFTDAEQGKVMSTLSQLRSLLRPWSTVEAQLASHMQLVQDLLLGEGHQSLDVLEVAEGLRRLGHSVVIRTALGGGGGGECLRNLRHTFLTCTEPGAGPADSRTFLVDPAFREQFEIPHASPRYAAILEAVPRVFIGTEDRIGPIVELLCSEISAAFKLAGATLPPWRAPGAMLSKWRPRKSQDLVLEDAAPLGSELCAMQSRSAILPHNGAASAGPQRGAAAALSGPALAPRMQLSIGRAGSSPPIACSDALKPSAAHGGGVAPINLTASCGSGAEHATVVGQLCDRLTATFASGKQCNAPASAMAAAAKHALQMV